MGVKEYRSVQVRQDVFMNRAFNIAGVRIPGIISRADAALAPKSISLAEPPANVTEAMAHLESAVQLFVMCTADQTQVGGEIVTENFVLATAEMFKVVTPQAKRQDAKVLRGTIGSLLGAMYSPAASDHYGRVLEKGMIRLLGYGRAKDEERTMDILGTVLAIETDTAIFEEALHSAITSGADFEWSDTAYVNRPGGASFYLLALLQMMRSGTRNNSAVFKYLRSLPPMFSVQSIKERAEDPSSASRLFMGLDRIATTQQQIECFMSPFAALQVPPSLTAGQISIVTGCGKAQVRQALNRMVLEGSMADNQDGTFTFCN